MKLRNWMFALIAMVGLVASTASANAEYHHHHHHRHHHHH
jgi:hypothetical protein